MRLLERDSYLEELRECLAQVADGNGQLVFLGGESGIGKSSLIEQFVTEARLSARTAVVSCDGLTMPGPFGPLFDIAEALGPEVEKLLAEQAPRAAIFRAVLAAFRAAPGTTVMVGEDAHWTDEATLELIRFLGRRIGGTRALLILTYRDDELGPYHPLRRVLGDLANAPAVRRIDLPPLSLDAVRKLVAGTEIDPIELHQRTDGNPFFVTETVGAGTAGVPATVRDAVLARAARLSAEGRALLDAVAAIGVTADPELLTAVIGGPIENSVEECLAVGMLRPSERAIIFRHGIARDAILTTMSLPRSRALHRRILNAMQRNPALAKDLAHLAHHAEAAADAEAVLKYATAAARHAAAFRSHKEAAAQYARALQYAENLPCEERVRLMEARAYECYLTGDLDQAIAVQEDVVDLWRDAGNQLRQGDTMRWLSRFYWFAGRNELANRYGLEAYKLVESLPPGAELAMACSNLSQLRMLSQDVPAAIEWGERAIELATQLGDEQILAHALTNVGTAHLTREDEHGRTMLEQSLEIARRQGFEDDISRALTNLGWADWSHGQLTSAEQYLDEGVAYTSERDLVAMELYQRALKASIWLARGDMARALDEAETISQLPASTLLSRIVALTCIARIRVMHGDDAGGVFDEASELADQTGELQRRGHVVAARAEAAWLVGSDERIIDEVGDVFDAAVASGNRWIGGELALWLHRAGRSIPTVSLAEPFALEISGEHMAAAATWDALGYPLEAARARASSGDEDDLRAAINVFDQLGSKADAMRVVRQLREMGARRIPRGLRPETRANAGMLTARELEVLAQLAEGRSNRAIADQLYLSPKTVGHHVSSILGKLNVTSRGEAVEHAHALGMLRNRESNTPK